MVQIAPEFSDSGGEMVRSADLVEGVRKQIEAGKLQPGARLLPVRKQAEKHKASPATVMAAYEALVALGLVESRPRSGFFVRSKRTPTAVRDTQAAGVSEDSVGQPVDAAALLRNMFHGQLTLPAPGFGTLPPSWLDLKLLLQSQSEALKQERARGVNAFSLSYGDPRGEASFRASIARLVDTCGVRARPEKIISAAGATHALDFVSRALFKPGDSVIVDEPGWPVEYARLQQLGVQALPIPRLADGPDLNALAKVAQQHRPKAYMTVSVLHNPSGYSLSINSAHRILRIAEAENFLVIEDDSYSWFANPHLPRMSALDGLERTIYVGGFSKILAPNWRVGFVIAPQQLQASLLSMKLLSALTCNAITERAVAIALDNGTVQRHAERINRRLAGARNLAVSSAIEAGCSFVSPPEGLFGWLDTGCDTEKLARAMLARGWLLAPGHLFFPTRKLSTLMRVNFATAQDASMWKAVAELRRSMGVTSS